MEDKMIFRNRIEFREWLKNNALSDNGIWIVFSKKKAFETIKANEALEEALCYGWIDGQMQSLDEYSYIKYFKQRNKNSSWSEKNKKLVQELEQKKLMTDFGRAKIEEAKKYGKWDTIKGTNITEEQMKEFEDMLKPYELAYSNYVNMSTSIRKTYAKSYYLGAKTDEGKAKRFSQIIERLNLNLNPMESIKKTKCN